jgi:hypothetical protein
MYIGCGVQELLKTLFAVITLLSAPAAMSAQTPLRPDEALAQIYKDYDLAKHQAKWVCSASQKSPDPATRDGWPCDEGEVVRVTVLSISQLQEGQEWKTYVVASASPGENPHDYECHACGPAIGVAIFAWQDDHWLLRDSNAAVGFYGSGGGGPDVELVAIGPARHGVILWTSVGGQGYHGSEKHLIAPIDNTVSEIWTLGDETDNSGAYDPTDKLAPHQRYYAEASFKFIYVGKDDYYDILAMSRGMDNEGKANWTKQYRFRDGQYRLLRTTTYLERIVPAKGPARGTAPGQK